MSAKQGHAILAILAANWQIIVFALSLDAIFIWTCILGLGDRDFQFVDPFFIAQLQFKIVGVLILVFAFSSLVSNMVRSFVMLWRHALIRRILGRKLYRNLFAAYRVEGALAFILFFSAMMGSIPQMLLVSIIGAVAGAASAIMLMFLGVPIGPAAVAKARVSAFQRRAAVAILYSMASRRIWNYTQMQARSALRLIAKFVLVIFAVGAGLSHAEKLKNSKTVSFSLPNGTISGAIVGQTGSGFLVWLDTCDCLALIGIGQVEIASHQLP